MPAVLRVLSCRLLHGKNTVRHVSNTMKDVFMQPAQPAADSSAQHPARQGQTAAFLALALFFVSYNTSAVFFQLRGVPAGHLGLSLLGYLAGLLLSALAFDRLDRKGVWQSAGRDGRAARAALLAWLLLPGLFCLVSFQAIPYSATLLLNIFQPFLWGAGLPVAHRLFFRHVAPGRQALLFGLAVGAGHLCWSLLMLPAGVLTASGAAGLTETHILPFLNLLRALSNGGFALLAWRLVCSWRNKTTGAAERDALEHASPGPVPARDVAADLARLLLPFALCFLLSGLLGYLFASRLLGRGPYAEYMHLGLALLFPLFGLAISRKGGSVLTGLFCAAVFLFGLAPLAAFRPSPGLGGQALFLACAMAHQVILSLGSLALARFAPRTRHPALVLSLAWLVSFAGIPGNFAASRLLPFLGVPPLTVAAALAALCIMSLWPLRRVLSREDFRPAGAPAVPVSTPEPYTEGILPVGGMPVVPERSASSEAGQVAASAAASRHVEAPPVMASGAGAGGANNATVSILIPVLCMFAAQAAFYAGASTFLLCPNIHSGIAGSFGGLALGVAAGTLLFPGLSGQGLRPVGENPRSGNRARLITAAVLFLACTAATVLRLHGDWLYSEPLRNTANFLLGLQVAVAYGLYFSCMPEGRRGLWLGLSLGAGMLTLRLMLLLGSRGLDGAAAVDAAPITPERFLPVFVCQLALYMLLALALLWGLYRLRPAHAQASPPDARARFESGSGQRRSRILRLLAALLVLLFLNSFMDASLFPVMPGRAGGSVTLHLFLALCCPLAGYLVDRDCEVWGKRIFTAGALLFLFTPVLLGAGPPAELARLLHGLASLALFVTVTIMSVALSRLARGPLFCLIVAAPFALRVVPMLGGLAMRRLGSPPPYVSVWCATLAAFAFYLLVRGGSGENSASNGEAAGAPSPEQARLEAARLEAEAAQQEAEAKFRAFSAAFGLSRCESEVLAGILRGLERDAIGAELGVSERTVKYHITGLLGKTEAANRRRLLHFYTDWQAG